MKKDKKWAQKEVDRYLSYEGVNEARNALTFAKGVINQLDEPETLSQEWIDEHAEHHEYIGYAGVPVEGLQNLLVPKQELPVIPKFVADYINRIKKSGKGIDGAFAYIKAYGWDDESSYEYEVYKWLGIGSNAEIFARAWLDGFTIEEEQKYRVIDSHKVYLLAKEEDRNEVETVAELVEFYGHEHVELNYQLTEQEIKDYDPRYWAFRKPVEELEK